MYFDSSDNSDNSDNDNETTPKKAFVKKLTEYIESIDKYKSIYKNEMSKYWKPAYAKIEKELKGLLDLCEYNWLDAKKKYEGYKCIHYENFSQYVFNTDLKNMKHIKGNSVRSKTLRRKRSNKCPKCNKECETTADPNVLKCSICGYEIMKDKSGTPDNMINNEKYMRKQLDKLIGLTKLPNSIVKILPYLTIWLTEWKHIRDWLLYSRRYDDFIDHYTKRTNKYLTFDGFDTVIERTENNKMNFTVYELFIEEFYKLTEVCQTTSRKQTTILLEDSEILQMIEQYLKIIKKKKFSSVIDLPDENYIIEYNGRKYSLGIYLNKLSLLVNYDEHHIKSKIVNQFCSGGKDCLIFPGLLFNFDEIFGLKDNIPRSFNYSENYNKIMNEVFYSKFTNIPKYDIDKIIDILLRYNDYYKKNVKKIGKKKETKTNSPLFVCTIKCIVSDLSYFNKYVDILEQTPHRITESTTKNEIDRLWHKFITAEENRGLLESYDNAESINDKQEANEEKETNEEENTISFFDYNLSEQDEKPKKEKKKKETEKKPKKEITKDKQKKETKKEKKNEKEISTDDENDEQEQQNGENEQEQKEEQEQQNEENDGINFMDYLNNCSEDDEEINERKETEKGYINEDNSEDYDDDILDEIL